MTFQEAEAELKLLLPTANLITLAYKKGIWHNWQDKENDIECSVTYCLPDVHHADRADANTWQGVIDKVKIMLMPKGVPISEEEPKEVQ